MPIYEYECERCHCAFERKQGYEDEPAAVCQCGGKARRVLHSVPIIFKGSGFYVTDHKQGSSTVGGDGSAGTKTEAPKEKVAAEAKPSPTAEVKSAPAPASKPEAKSA